MEGLIELIDEITKFGLYPLVELSDKERNLEWNLIKLYKLYFDIKLEQEHFGYANFDNGDKSKNSTPFDFFMLGELFQNNHHKRPNNANFAAKWFEFDPVYPVMKFRHWIRLIKLREAYL